MPGRGDSGATLSSFPLSNQFEALHLATGAKSTGAGGLAAAGAGAASDQQAEGAGGGGGPRPPTVPMPLYDGSRDAAENYWELFRNWCRTQNVPDDKAVLGLKTAEGPHALECALWVTDLARTLEKQKGCMSLETLRAAFFGRWNPEHTEGAGRGGGGGWSRGGGGSGGGRGGGGGGGSGSFLGKPPDAAWTAESDTMGLGGVKLTWSQKQQFLNQGLCYKCGQPGHRVSSCRSAGGGGGGGRGGSHGGGGGRGGGRG
ncbi:hypothetical protein HYH03_000003 [Edaphochlamys debaryana]|uniref:CCHC-type domain-containing protein n=1 Tax=Edaphochlamys debaryana TaxID=47281 RepID=A0A835YER3_9CHLO|nr:hypothetical protein HYH03_000003 [Edaphochlamys debaryana]|eukprot:KAG2501495.1 hypothetical protein HYH03_000003 [Edaphochlamys debaryana]